jgi:hypothetical protein
VRGFPARPCAPARLRVGEPCLISVTFVPGTAGAKTAQVRLATSEAGSPRIVELTGTGAQPGDAAVSPASLAFTGTPGTVSAAQTLTLTNTGSDPLRRGAMSVRGVDAGAFRRAAGCSTTADIPPGGTCTITVRYAPPGPGLHLGVLRIPTDRTDALLVPLSGDSTGG